MRISSMTSLQESELVISNPATMAIGLSCLQTSLVLMYAMASFLCKEKRIEL